MSKDVAWAFTRRWPFRMPALNGSAGRARRSRGSAGRAGSDAL